MINFPHLFSSAAEQAGISLTAYQLQQFHDYFQLLITWNNKINLTAITEEKEVVEKHFLDSLLADKIIKLNNKDNLFDKFKPIKVIDVGTGAGFPGIPLKIIFTELEIILLDSLNKRINFLNEVIDKLQLKNITCLHGRAEDIGQDKAFREHFDLVVSRAVASLQVLLELCLPFVNVNGYFLAYKGSEVDQEIIDANKALIELGGEIVQIEKLKLPMSGAMRNLVLIRKVKNTPQKYPRKAGTPSKKPI